MKLSITKKAKGGKSVKGRLPKPDVLKEAQGTLKKSRVNHSQAKFGVPEKFPAPPSTLNVYGKRYWRKIGPKLKETGLYTEGDFTALELLCAAYGDWVQAQKDAEVSGRVAFGKNGVPFQHPHVSMANQAWKRVQEMLGRFGLTPAERSRVKAFTPAEKTKSLAESLFAEARAKVEGGDE